MGDVSVLSFVKLDGKTWELTDEQVQTWRQVYDGVDVERECRHAWAWHDANPSKRKKNVKAFLVNWLNHAKPVRGTQAADDRGHVPPCRTVTECTQRALAEAREKRG